MDQISRHRNTKPRTIARFVVLKLLTKTIPRVGIPHVEPAHVHLPIVGVPVHVRHVADRIARTVFLCKLVLFTDSLLPKFLCFLAVASNVPHHDMVEISMRKLAQAVSYYWQIVIPKNSEPTLQPKALYKKCACRNRRTREKEES